MLEKLRRAVGYCRVVCCIFRIVEKCSEDCDHSIMILSITAVLGPHEFGPRI